MALLGPLCWLLPGGGCHGPARTSCVDQKVYQPSRKQRGSCMNAIAMCEARAGCVASCMRLWYNDAGAVELERELTARLQVFMCGRTSARHQQEIQQLYLRRSRCEAVWCSWYSIVLFGYRTAPGVQMIGWSGHAATMESRQVRSTSRQKQRVLLN